MRTKEKVTLRKALCTVADVAGTLEYLTAGFASVLYEDNDIGLIRIILSLFCSLMYSTISSLI